MGKTVRVLPALKEGFCQCPSPQYSKMLEECWGDPRIVEGRRAMNRAKHGWHPTWESRDIRGSCERE